MKLNKISKKIKTASQNSKLTCSEKKRRNIHIILLWNVDNNDSNLHILPLSRQRTNELL